MRWFQKLRQAGVLGINARNARFIFRHNPRRLFPLVDDKIRCKALCAEYGIPTPELYGIVEAHGDLRRLGDFLAGHDEFVIKPARGAMGNGVLVIEGRDGPLFRKPSGARLDERAVKHYVSGILSGLYSLSGTVDRAMIEYRVQRHPLFDELSSGGVPDIRVIVFKGVPVLAMVRLPTNKSDGRANLHQGAIAAGIDLATGTTHCAVQANQLVERHPDTGARVIGVTIPHWEEILRIAARTHDMTGLGYIGVDVVLDAVNGPMLLEANARPGLAIQIANFQGLLHRLKKIERVDTSRLDVDARLEFARRVLPPTPRPQALPPREVAAG